MPAAARFAETLKLSGHRLTQSRRAVMEAVLAGDDHFSIADVQQRARGVGRATVFRTMKLLVDLDLVCRVPLEDGTPCYRVSRPSHHHHLVCTGCGNVEDFADCDLEAMAAEIASRTAYEIQGHRLEMYGLCPACRAEAGSMANIRREP